jgi:hypothetical protein
MSLTQHSTSHEYPLPADERTPLRLPWRRPRRWSRPFSRGSRPDPPPRPEPVPMWIAGAASRARAAMEADVGRRP